MKREAGFTLTELMVTLSIVAILLTIGVPSYKYVTTANRVTTEINGLLGDIQFARSEAIREGQNVVLCQSADNKTCTADSANWNGGWLVWSDLNGDGNLDPAKELLRLQKAFLSSDTLQADGASNLSSITFNREGFATGVTARLTLRESTNKAVYARCLDLSPVGIPTTTNNTADSTCK